MLPTRSFELANERRSGAFAPTTVYCSIGRFSDASFLKTVGSISQGVINRSAWDIGRPDSTTFRINEMFKKREVRREGQQHARFGAAHSSKPGRGLCSGVAERKRHSAAQAAVQGLVRTGGATTLARRFPLFRHVGNPHCLVTRLSLSRSEAIFSGTDCSELDRPS
jgi:hypothetical protein